MSTYRLKIPLRPSGDTLGDNYNEAMEILDHLVQTSVTSETDTPAVGPLVGASYLVGPNPTGVWAGRAGRVVVFDGTDWDYIDPPTGMIIFDAGAATFKRWTGAAWVAMIATAAESVTGYPADFAGEGGKLLRVNSNSPEDGVEFVATSALGLASEFTDLTDAPASYDGAAGQLLRVNANSPPDGVEFVAVASLGLVNELLDLVDTPTSYAGASEYLLRVNGNSPPDGIEFVSVASLGLVNEFTDLTDAPTSYAGAAGKLLRVNNNSPEDGLEFVAFDALAQPAVVAVTDAATAAGDGTIYTNEGDADGATLTLPAAAAGRRVTAIVQTAQTLTVTANAADTIRLAADETAPGGSISSAAVGSAVQLVAINAADTGSSPDVPGEWVAVSIVGSWSL